MLFFIFIYFFNTSIMSQVNLNQQVQNVNLIRGFRHCCVGELQSDTVSVLITKISILAPCCSKDRRYIKKEKRKCIHLEYLYHITLLSGSLNGRECLAKAISWHIPFHLINLLVPVLLGPQLVS